METQNKVFVKRKFNCPPSELFNWLIQPDLLAKWFGPQHFLVGSVQMDVRVGGKYAIELISPDKKRFLVVGEYKEIIPPHRLIFSYRYEGRPSNPHISTVSIIIEAISEKESLLNLKQEFETEQKNMSERTKAWEHMFDLIQQFVLSE